ncbi:tRNA-cytidine(32) 2-sulfurtransferase [Eumeta japonica]|uniref:tRNA-cytidine(32) 2-sulfurtransferase n=1 Tax=Eumeta variegata TaxID=151549 RepID=A0A4C1YRU8_EUMVA|nr:tRNA-cytidine(32) 2-sulfurtransferase [Eumeta japonica]
MYHILEYQAARWQVLAHIKNIPELILLGSESLTARRLPIFSLMVKHPRGTFLHHNFVCAVLNDVFGIQARGGLSSNLAYGEDVLGIDNNLLKEYEKLLDVEAQKEIARFRKISDAKAPEIPIHNEHLRPGFCRVSLPYFMSESELAFVLEALKMVATEGWKILPQYVVNPETGQWSHYSNSILRDRKSLYSVRYHDGKMTANDRRYSGPGIFPQTYTECLQTARNLFNRARKLAMKCAVAEPEMGFNPRIDYLRWFMLPKEAHDLLLGKSANVKHIVPFDPSGYTGARKSLISSRSNITSSPIFGSSPRHFSLSALDDCQILRLKQKPIFYSRESSLKENQKENTVVETHKPSPVQFALGESVSPIQLKPKSSIPQTVLVRSRCYSLGSDSPPGELSPETKMNLGLKESSPNVVTENVVGFCHCGSQTDLQSLDDPMILPSKSLPYSAHNSVSDCSQFGRSSPTISVASHNSEDLHAYVKEMTKELATEIKSEIREVISQVDDILENSDTVEQCNLSLNSTSSHSNKNSVSVIDVTEYLMGMSKEMASEVKHEIREMVNQVDEMISPDYAYNGSRRSSPPQSARRRIGSGPDLGLDLKKASQCLKKCPTSPVLPTDYIKDEEQFCKRSPLSSNQSPKSVSRTPPQETSGPNSISFSSETSTPDTIIQVVTANQNSPNLPKSLSSNKLSDEDVHCSDVACRHYCIKKNWCLNPSVSSQDSGINMTFTDTDTYLDFGKWRTSSDPTTKKSKELQGRLRMCQRHEKSEVPDIIEGVPVCASQPVERRNCRQEQTDVQGNSPIEEAKRSSRSSIASSSCSDRSSRSSGYGTDVQRLPVQDEHDSDGTEIECKCPKAWCEVNSSGPAGAGEEGDSSACSDTSLSEFTCDEAPWHCPPKRVWKPALEALSEYNMVRPGDKVLVCLSGCRESVALLHTLHHYQFYSRSKGIHFSIGALYVHEPHSDVDPLHLMAYCRTLGVKLVYQDKIDDTELERRDATRPCEAHRWSTHAVRRRAYVAASSHGYHVVAVAQHLDDAARAFLANVFHCGALRTMKAHYCVREHDLRIIRPLIYVRESDLERWTYARRLPDFRADCAVQEEHAHILHADSDESSVDDNKDATETVRSAAEPASPVAGARDLLVRQEHQHPGLFASLKRALHPLISSRNIEKDLKERHRKKSVIQMKNGAPVYDSEEGTDEEPVP